MAMSMSRLTVTGLTVTGLTMAGVGTVARFAGRCVALAASVAATLGVTVTRGLAMALGMIAVTATLAVASFAAMRGRAAGMRTTAATGLMPTVLLAAGEDVRHRLAVAALASAAAMFGTLVDFTTLGGMRSRMAALGATRLVRTLTTRLFVRAFRTGGIAMMLAARLVVRTRRACGIDRELVAMIAAAARGIGSLTVALGTMALITMALAGAVVARRRCLCTITGTITRSERGLARMAAITRGRTT